jgi:glycosyltransferase involved in cell wall biosynthesis
LDGLAFRFYSRGKDVDLNTAQRWYWENVQLPLLSRRDKLDILHIPAFAPPYVKNCKLVVTVHDLIGMLFPNQLRWPSAFYWGKWLPFTLRRADAIIADSENTKRDLIGGLKIPEQKIHVVYLSGHEGFTSQIPQEAIQAAKKQYGIVERYFLFVGTIEPRKNLDRVIEAFAAFLHAKKKSSRYQLVVVGSKEFGHGKFFQSLANKFGVTLEDVIFTGYVSKENLNALYCGAETFVYPSLYEGFGIPILEAMAAGAPVLTSTKTSVPEVAGDAALLVDPYDVKAIMQGMIDMSEDASLRRSMIAKGFERIKRFSWAETSRKTVEVYQSLF